MPTCSMACSHDASPAPLAAPALPPALQQPLSSAQLRRNRDKLVSLLEEGQYALLEEGELVGGPSPVPSPVTTQARGGGQC